ncbi:MAG: SpoIIE family protein phosphatase [Verrucomicrobiales bacterium]|nr:SpoIIE family protein phosphatase [Verrucomicrobiales bacterium]
MPLVTSTPARVLNLSGPCDLGAIRDAARAIRAFLEQSEVAPEEIDGWELVAVEAGNNAVDNVGPEGIDLPVDLCVEVGPTYVELRVHDHTPGFDMPESAELPDPLSESGRGLFLMRTLTDRMSYQRGPERNTLVLRKCRSVSRDTVLLPEQPDTASLEATLHTMTEELAASYESLSAIFRFAAEFNRSELTQPAVDQWFRELATIVGAEWYVFRTARPEAGGLVVACASGSGIGLPPLPLAPESKSAHPSGLEAQAVASHKDVWFYGNQVLAADDPLASFGSPLACVVHPVYVNAELVGVLTAGRYSQHAPFSAVQVNILHTFADFLGIALRNTWVREQQLRVRLVTHELEIAANIQRSLLPVRLPEPHGFRLAGHSQSANTVGGDLFDVMKVGSQGILLVIADVMGKGVPAALFAAILRNQIRARPDLASRPGHFMSWLNQVLFTDLDRVDMFITVQLAFLDPVSRELRVASAGHCPLLVAYPDESMVEIAADGPPLGISRHSEFPEPVLTLADGVRALMLTDGLTELRDPDENLLGIEAVRSWLLRAAVRRMAATEAHDTLLDFARTFRRSAQLRDDLTFIVVADHPEPKVPAEADNRR